MKRILKLQVQFILSKNEPNLFLTPLRIWPTWFIGKATEYLWEIPDFMSIRLYLTMVFIWKENLNNYPYGATLHNASVLSFVGLYRWNLVMHWVSGALISSFWYFRFVWDCGLCSFLEGFILYYTGGISTRHCSSWQQKGEC